MFPIGCILNQTGGNMSRYKDHKDAVEVFRNVENNPEKYFLIHYSCESFINITDGRTPRITSIAVKSIATGQVESFSLHKTAEQKNIPFHQISERYDEIETDMLNEYFAFVKDNRNMFYLHINMRDINYGFKAIEHRGKVLKADVFPLPDSQKIDMAVLLKKRFGDNYIGHPRMESLCALNEIKSIGYLKGAEEADAFERHEYVKLHQSTLAKVEMYTNILKRTINGSLKTKAKWYEIHGLSIQGILAFIDSKWWLKLLLWLLTTVAAGVIGFYINELLQ